MGIGPFRGSKCESGSIAALPSGNPDPRRFQILRYQEVFAWTVVEVRYPDAKNYEGKKVLVYPRRASEVLSQTVLDPHFCDDRAHLSPFARFEPTEAGWDAAVILAKCMA